MKTETEIKAMSLSDLQKLVVELRAVRTDDKFYSNAKSMIALATGLKKWVEPKLIQVKNIADHMVSIDGQSLAQDATGNVYPWQYTALSRFLEVVKTAAGMIALAFVFSCGLTAQAQVQPIIVGTPGTYHVFAIDGLNGGTNALTWTNSLLVGVITTNTINSPTVYNSNGIVYVTTNSTSTYLTNTPGELGVVNHDLLDIFWGYAASNSVYTGTNATLGMDVSDDGILWRTNAYTFVLQDLGVGYVSTNIQLSAFAPGYIRFNTMAFPNGLFWFTNATLEVAVKNSKTGP